MSIRPIEFLTVVDFYQLLDNVYGTHGNWKHHRNTVLLHVLWSTGVRVSELAGLTVGDLRLDAERLTVLGKGRKQRWVGITRQSLAELKVWVDEDLGSELDNAVFPRWKHEPKKSLQPAGIRHILDGCLKRSGLTKRVTPHIFRHSMAVRMQQNNVSLLDIQRQLGHESLDMTNRYLRSFSDSHIEAMSYVKDDPRPHETVGADACLDHLVSVETHGF